MKYAYILGSNAFISPHGYISFTHKGEVTSFLSIRSVYHDTAEASRLSVDLNIPGVHGQGIKLTENRMEHANGFNLTEQRDRVVITKPNGDAIIDIHQLDDQSAMDLEHNIVAELEVNAPIAVIRIRGNFMLNDMHIEIDNEKLFINGNSYANSVRTGKTNLDFAEEGVVLS